MRWVYVYHTMASDWNINRIISWHTVSRAYTLWQLSLTRSVIIIIILIPRLIFIVLSSTVPAICQSSFGSSGRKSVNDRWPPASRPGCKLWPLSPPVGCYRTNIHPSPFVLVLNPKVDTHLLSSEGGRPSRPRHCNKGAAHAQSCVLQWFLCYH